MSTGTDIKGKVVVVTGASAGIGACVAQLVAERGGRPVLVARRADALAEVAQKCGTNAVTLVADVTKRADVTATCARAIETCGGIDVWINNAGRGISKMPSELTDEDVDDMMTVNLKSVLYGMQAVLPHFKERARGQIINVSSLLGRVPLAPIRSAYIAAKHAMNGLTGAMRMELAASHPSLVVTAVHPGVVATDFGKNAKHGGADSRALPNAQSAEDVAAVIVGAIEKPRVDVYTTDFGRGLVVGYYSDDMAAAEAKLLRR